MQQVLIKHQPHGSVINDGLLSGFREVHVNLNKEDGLKYHRCLTIRQLFAETSIILTDVVELSTVTTCGHFGHSFMCSSLAVPFVCHSLSIETPNARLVVLSTNSQNHHLQLQLFYTCTFLPHSFLFSFCLLFSVSLLFYLPTIVRFFYLSQR